MYPTLGGRYYHYPHFTDWETGQGRGGVCRAHLPASTRAVAELRFRRRQNGSRMHHWTLCDFASRHFHHLHSTRGRCITEGASSQAVQVISAVPVRVGRARAPQRTCQKHQRPQEYTVSCTSCTNAAPLGVSKGIDDLSIKQQRAAQTVRNVRLQPRKGSH